MMITAAMNATNSPYSTAVAPRSRSCCIPSPYSISGRAESPISSIPEGIPGDICPPFGRQGGDYVPRWDDIQRPGLTGLASLTIRSSPAQDGVSGALTPARLPLWRDCPRQLKPIETSSFQPGCLTGPEMLAVTNSDRGRVELSANTAKGPAANCDEPITLWVEPRSAQRLIMWPAMPSTASFTASERLGWAWMFRPTSSAVRSHCWARVSSGNNSETSGPTRCAPSSSL
jgi:hypothetical protein